MKKIEYVWRELLYRTIEQRKPVFGQQELAAMLGLSSSTVNLALAPLRRLGAVTIGKRHSEVIDYEKILYHWANHRAFSHDIKASLHLDIPVREIEGRLPTGTIPTAYTAVHELFGEPPADYGKVYCYHHDPQVILKRLTGDSSTGEPNLFILHADPHLGSSVSLSQLFVDLWNLTDWYAKDFCNFVKAKIEEKL
ncbi:MAG: helix-turn-helix domain-containing protein [Candidatus Gottesmanbacteria bacterium]|nr:helix-turn-helix domain-containing protein [Candidatus Gottesmanbacteria bacterium]